MREIKQHPSIYTPPLCLATASNVMNFMYMYLIKASLLIITLYYVIRFSPIRPGVKVTFRGEKYFYNI